MANALVRASGQQNRFALVFLVLVLAVVSVVPWRRGTIYSGGADPVVVAKAVVGLVAFGASVALYSTARTKATIGVRTLSLLAGIVLISAVGAFAAGDAIAALVLTIRIALITVTIVIVAKSAPPIVVLVALLAALGAIALVSAVTGAMQGFTDGRLAGGIPEMAPNVLAGLAAPPAIGLAADVVRRGVRLPNTAALVVLLSIVFYTQSRTTLIVVIIGFALALVFGRKVATSTAIVAIIGAPVLCAVMIFTDTATQLLARGQNELPHCCLGGCARDPFRFLGKVDRCWPRCQNCCCAAAVAR